MIEIISRPELGQDILGLQPRDKAAMLVVNTTELFPEEFAWKWSLVKGERCFGSWSSTWPPWRHVQTSNMSFPSSPGPLYQNEVKCSAFDMEVIFILMQVKLIFTRKVVHLASFWKWGFLELGSGLFPKVIYVLFPLQTSTLPPSLALAHFFLFEKSLGRVIVRIISSFQSHPYSISCNYSNELTCVSKWAVTLQAD